MANSGRPTPDELPPPAASTITPKALAGFRHELDQRKYDAVDGSWAGSVPAQYGVAPRVRIGRSKWFNLLWLLPIGFVLPLIHRFA
ncbi:hypothetical protein [Brevibacterium aurantiacum]|uniref:Uncharacterized protein n=1 Tax=Brevibacterium aurantiacum TaxID=273384 RepID=A0A3T0DEW3_BREAU|nr:hypothetical protein [Brevibacterium aurantiacum]AZT93508.1 hypothetical protein CXR23_10480 [Brevibacterium aurantiacum]